MRSHAAGGEGRQAQAEAVVTEWRYAIMFVCLFVREVLICTVATRLVLLHFLPPRAFIFVPVVAVLLPVVSVDELRGATAAMLISRLYSVLPSR